MNRKELLNWTCDEIGVHLGSTITPDVIAELDRFEGVTFLDAIILGIAPSVVAIVNSRLG